jgi:hypothetical protein
MSTDNNNGAAASMSSNGLNVDKDALAAMMFKLLDKAGRDQRLTPRVLRKKAEEKLKLPSGGLDDKKELMKKIIMKWWSLQPEAKQAEQEQQSKHEHKHKEQQKEHKSSSSSSSSQAISKSASNDSKKEKHDERGPEHVLNRLSKLAKAAGKGPNFFASFKDMELKEKVSKMRAR